MKKDRLKGKVLGIVLAIVLIGARHYGKGLTVREHHSSDENLGETELLQKRGG